MQSAYSPWTSPPRGPFVLVMTSHANGRLHERKREAWDNERRTAKAVLLWRLVDRGYELWRLNVRGRCQVVVDDLRVVFCVSSRMARVLTVMRASRRPRRVRRPAMVEEGISR